MRKEYLLALLLTCTGLLGFPAAAQLSQPPPGSPTTGQPGNPSTSPSTSPMDERTPTVGNPNGTAMPPMTPVRVDDKKFLKDATMSSMTEVEVSKIAMEKASSDEVKQFAKKVVDDHSKATDELKQVAKSQNMEVPEALDSKRQSKVEKLSKLSGADFDKAYVKEQVKNHEKDVRAFQMAAENGTDPAVKSVAAKLLPDLQQHLAMAKELKEK